MIGRAKSDESHHVTECRSGRKSGGVELERSYQTPAARCSALLLRLKATLAATNKKRKHKCLTELAAVELHCG